MKRTLSILAVIAWGMMTSCNKIDNIDNNIEPQTPVIYSVSIPASFEGDATTRAVTFDNSGATPTSTSTFLSTEKVYVYNVSTDEVMGGYLQPTDISANGKSCNLTGTLTGTINAGDNLRLMYNLTHVETDKTNDYYKNNTEFNYNTQDGTQSGVVDGAEATVTVGSYTSGSVLTTTATASFQTVQSMFRFKFVDGSTPISVKVLRIQSSSFGIRDRYFPIRTGDLFGTNDVMLNLPTATSDYIYFGMAIDENYTDDVLTFTVTDASGNVYTGTKSAPTDGFKKGKYYYNTSAITLTKLNYLTPDITWTNPSTPIAPNEYYEYHIYNDVSNSDITISGISKGYCFRPHQDATVRLNNLTATYDANNNPFIYGVYNLTLEVNGTNTINCKNYNQAIFVEKTLKLRGNGTLTVTATDDARYGIYADLNYKKSNNSDASVLAADGYIVTRSARIDGPDNNSNGVPDYYTWTYTVAPVPPFTVNAGSTKVLFAPGNLQATFNGSSWSWAFAANQWDYIGNGGASIVGNEMVTDTSPFISGSGTVDLFGWVGASSNWTGVAQYGITSSGDTDKINGYGNVATEALKSDWGSLIGTGWRTLTSDEWTYVFNTRESGSTVNGTPSARYTHATINTDGTSVNGIILFPDGVTINNSEATSWGAINGNSDWGTKCTSAKWTALAAKGCVFLPAAGYRTGTSLYNVDTYGYYWSSSASPSDVIRAYRVSFYSKKLNPAETSVRNSGFSVRLVRVIE